VPAFLQDLDFMRFPILLFLLFRKRS